MGHTEGMGRTRLRFGVLMDVAFSFFQEEPRRGIARHAGEAGIDVVYFGMRGLNPASPEDQAKEAFFDFLTAREVDGLIIVCTSLTNSGQHPLRAHLKTLEDLPMVSIGSSVTGEDNVAIDNRMGVRLIMDHLIADHGYREFARLRAPEQPGGPDPARILPIGPG